MIALDIDGTLLDYDLLPGQPPAINTALLAQLTGKSIALVTNQGGLAFGWAGRDRTEGRKFPSPADFMQRLSALMQACAAANITIKHLHVCIFHPKANMEIIGEVQYALFRLLCNMPFQSYIHTDSEHRKPSPAMLQEAGATIYYGDSDDDEQAAQAAGIEFVRVERFMR